MKKYVCMLIALLAVSVFSFTQAFDMTVSAVGGDPDCNGSDVLSNISCDQLPGGQTCDSEYAKVTDSQPYKDVHYFEKTECASSGCVNVTNNHSPRSSPCVKHLEDEEIPIDP